MATTLTWEDLFSQDPHIDFVRIFSCWPTVDGSVLPMGLSAFGDAFFTKPDQTVWRLDSFSGSIEQVAGSQAEFVEAMNTPAWQEKHLRSRLVLELKERGFNRAPRQVFAPVPHPAIADAPQLERTQVMDAVVWHSISSQTLSQVAALSPKKAKPSWRFCERPGG